MTPIGLKRQNRVGSVDYIFSELCNIFSVIKISLDKLKTLKLF